MSGIETAFKVVAICVGIATVIKILLDIAANPRHRDTTLIFVLVCLRAVLELLPIALVLMAFFLLSSPAWSSAAIFLGIVFAVFRYALGTGDPRRIETAYLVLFVGFGFFVALLLMFGAIGDRLTEAAAPEQIEAPKD